MIRIVLHTTCSIFQVLQSSFVYSILAVNEESLQFDDILLILLFSLLLFVH